MRRALLVGLLAGCGPDARLEMTAIEDAAAPPAAVRDAGREPKVRLSAVAPAAGPAGTPIELLGSGFEAGLEVYFGAAPAREVQVLGEARARCLAPEGAGLVDVRVGDALLAAAFRYEAVGGAPPPPPPDAGASALAPAPPQTLEAEAFTSSQGVMSLGNVVGFVDDGDWLAYAGVDFGGGAPGTVAVTLAAPAATAGQQLELRLDAPGGTLLGTLTVASTGGWDMLARQAVPLAGASGVHTLVVVARGTRDVANLDRLELNR